MDRVSSQSIGVVRFTNSAGVMPEKRAIAKPGPHESVSMRPSWGPRGVAKLTFDRSRLNGPSYSRLSTSGTDAAPCTVLRWT